MHIHSPCTFQIMKNKPKYCSCVLLYDHYDFIWFLYDPFFKNSNSLYIFWSIHWTKDLKSIPYIIVFSFLEVKWFPNKGKNNNNNNGKVLWWLLLWNFKKRMFDYVKPVAWITENTASLGIYVCVLATQEVAFEASWPISFMCLQVKSSLPSCRKIE